ncbi:MAG: hypothetical protein ACRDAW_01495 [Metamycoplasmataceae bacterium]
MHNTQFPYLANRKQINTNQFGYNQNQQFFRRTNNGWIIQGNTQEPEETQTLTLSITNKYKFPLNNNRISNIYYNPVSQQQYYQPAPQVVPIQNTYYNPVPQQQHYQPVPQVAPVVQNTYYNPVPQQQHYQPAPMTYPGSNVVYQPQHCSTAPIAPIMPLTTNNNHQSQHCQTNSNNNSQCNQSINNNQNQNINKHNNVSQYNYSPTTDGLLPLIYEAIDIAKTQKTLLYKFIDVFTK